MPVTAAVSASPAVSGSTSQGSQPLPRRSRRPLRLDRRAASAPAGSASTHPAQLPAASSSNALPTPAPTGALTVFADVAIKGAFSSAETGLTVAQAPDGAIFVAGKVASPQIIWVVDGVGPAGIAEHVKGPVTALRR